MRPVQFAFIFLLLFFNLSSEQLEKNSNDELNCDEIINYEINVEDQVFKNGDFEGLINIFSFIYANCKTADYDDSGTYLDSFNLFYSLHQKIFEHRKSFKAETAEQAGELEAFYFIWFYEMKHYLYYEEEEKFNSAIDFFIKEIPENISSVLQDINGNKVAIGSYLNSGYATESGHVPLVKSSPYSEWKLVVKKSVLNPA